MLDEKLVQRGYNATVHPHDFYNSLAEEAARLQKSGKGPIIIMGHSLGADAAIYMAEKMKTLGAPVALVVTFGPTTNLVAPSNVHQVINYYTGNTLVSKGPGFRGSISNINLNSAPDTNHMNIEKAIVCTPALSQDLSDRWTTKAREPFGGGTITRCRLWAFGASHDMAQMIVISAVLLAGVQSCSFR